MEDYPSIPGNYSLPRTPGPGVPFIYVRALKTRMTWKAESYVNALGKKPLFAKKAYALTRKQPQKADSGINAQRRPRDGERVS